jgi:tetratricopeptide (TPR) repeat protein
MMAGQGASRRRGANLRYLRVSLALLGLVALSGWLLSLWITQSANLPLSRDSEAVDAGQNVEQLFELAVGHMQRSEYELALQVWHRVLLRDAGIPEVRVNMGFTLYELEQLPAARNFFIGAMEQNPFQANAYYGLALVSEKSGDLKGAIGAMRSYIHLAAATEDEHFIRRARSALWEWEAQLSAPKRGEGLQQEPEQPPG